MQQMIKNTIRITFPNSHKSVFHINTTEKKKTLSENTSTRITAKRALKESFW